MKRTSGPTAAELSAKHNFPGRIDAVKLKDVLGDIQADCRDFHWNVAPVGAAIEEGQTNTDEAGSRGRPFHQMYGRAKIDPLQARLVGAT